MRNESSRALVERVQKSIEHPINLDIDISGLNIDYSVKTLILKNYQTNQPFGLSDETGEYMVYFFPSHGCAVWCDAGKVTLNTFNGNAQFEKCIKAALVAHRKFVGVMQLVSDDKYKEICEQLKQVG